MDKIRITHLITGLNTGGAEMMLYKVLSNIDTGKFENRVISLTGLGPMKDRIEALGIPLTDLGLSRRSIGIDGIARLMALFRRETPDILQTWLYHSDLLGLIAGRMRRVPHILWNIRCSNMDMRRYSKKTGLTIKLCAKFSSFPDVVIVNSQTGLDFHEAIGYKPKRWILIPNGFDLDKFKPNPSARETLIARLNIPDDSVLIGLVARYDPMKDHETFLKAAQILAMKTPKAHFVLAGKDVDERNEKLVGLAQSLGLGGRIHLMGEQRNIHELMPALVIVCSSSYGEGFPNVLGEAMACGVPCVTTNVGDSGQIIGDTGFAVPPQDPEKLAVAMLSMIDMGFEKRHELGEKARRRIEENYDMRKIARDYESLYESLTATPVPNPA